MPPNNKLAESKWQAMIQHKCPKCRRGKVFTHPFYSIAHFTEMYKNCPVCGHKFEIEPGYFYSAMFISYAITVILCLIFEFAVYYFLNDPGLWVYSSIIIGTMVLLAPVSLRFSRMMVLHLVTPVKFDEKWKSE